MAKLDASVADSTVVYQLSLLEQAINAPCWWLAMALP